MPKECTLSEYGKEVAKNIVCGCETWLEDIGTTKDHIKFLSTPFKTDVPRFSQENLSRQIKRLEKGKKLNIEFNKLLKIQEEIEFIKSMLKG